MLNVVDPASACTYYCSAHTTDRSKRSSRRDPRHRLAMANERVFVYELEKQDVRELSAKDIENTYCGRTSITPNASDDQLLIRGRHHSPHDWNYSDRKMETQGRRCPPRVHHHKRSRCSRRDGHHTLRRHGSAMPWEIQGDPHHD